MDALYVYEQPTAAHSDYFISITDLPAEAAVSLRSKYQSFSGSIAPNTCEQNCLLSVANNCPADQSQEHGINMFTIEVGGLPPFSYMVDCSPATKYKPFEWGLLLIIVFAILIVTVASLHNRAASLNNLFIKIDYKIVAFLNLILVVCGVLVYLRLPYFSFLANVSGSIAGTASVYIVSNEILWMLDTRLNRARVWRAVRALDVVSTVIALTLFTTYWAAGQCWAVSDIMSVSLVVACIKVFRIKSLKMATAFLLSVVLLETASGLLVHYVLGVSYNDLVVNQYSSPFFLQLPSITPELRRKCAWLPALSVVQPGLVISYLRSFDLSRGTWVYLLIGYASQYAGSLAWMLIDSSTVHTLPLGLIADPLMLVIVAIFAYRRNENRQLWLGLFHDQEDTYSLRNSTQ